jgi:ectoine hydroxylase-related dioxygenase (phytanoyl-CoA dioxygenase family)
VCVFRYPHHRIRVPFSIPGMSSDRVHPPFSVSNVVESLNARGYCILENFLPNIRNIQREFDQKLLPRTPKGRNRFEGGKTQRCYSLFNKTRLFDAFVTDPLVHTIVSSILGSEHFLLSSTVGINIGPGEKEQPLHRDDGKYPLPRPHDEVVVNCMIAINDFTKENGGTVLYPGSHVWEYSGENDYAVKHVLPNGLDESYNTGGISAMNIVSQLRQHNNGEHDKAVTAVQCEMKAGSVMIYRGSLLHGGGANNSPNPRLGVLIEFISAWLRPQENHVIGVDRNVVKHLPRKLQEMLGWTVSPPFIGYVDGRHPRRFLMDMYGCHESKL